VGKTTSVTRVLDALVPPSLRQCRLTGHVL